MIPIHVIQHDLNTRGSVIRNFSLGGTFGPLHGRQLVSMVIGEPVFGDHHTVGQNS